MGKPVIGITVDNADNTAASGKYESAIAYASAMTAAGGVPVLLPHVPELAEAYLELCDGLILTGGVDPRFRVEHAQILSREDIPRFKQLGVIPSMQPTHCTSDMYWAEDRVGPDRIEGAYAWKRLIDDGNIIPCGSDFPVEGADPLAGIYAAVTRRTIDGRNPEGWVPRQKISVEEAATAYTSANAYASYLESEVGRIAPGFYADLVVLSDDIFTIDPTDIERVRVDLTFVEGELVFEREGTS